MGKIIEKSAKTLDEALKASAEALGTTVDNVDYEIIHEMGKGLLGIFTGKEVTISAGIKGEYKPRVKTEDIAPKVKKEVKEPKETKKEQTKAAKTPKKTITTTDKTPVAPTPKFSRNDELEPITDEIKAKAEQFLTDLLRKLDLAPHFEMNVTDGVLNIVVLGENMGVLIGKRGDTLDAVQYLTSIYLNKGKPGYVKINIDTENYRTKRRETLGRLARSLESKVSREKRKTVLEPMSPYERRIIHSELQDSKRVKTYSIGDEPNRKVVVAPAD